MGRMPAWVESEHTAATLALLLFRHLGHEQTVRYRPQTDAEQGTSLMRPPFFPQKTAN